MGAEIRAQSPRLSAASDAGDLATAILVPVGWQVGQARRILQQSPLHPPDHPGGKSA